MFEVLNDTFKGKNFLTNELQDLFQRIIIQEILIQTVFYLLLATLLLNY